MNVSYREKSIWLHIVILGVIYGAYFSLFAKSAFMGNLVGGQWIGLLILTTLAIIFAEAISTIATSPFVITVLASTGTNTWNLI